MPCYKRGIHLLQSLEYKWKSLCLCLQPGNPPETDWAGSAASSNHTPVKVTLCSFSGLWSACCGWTTNLEMTLVPKASYWQKQKELSCNKGIFLNVRMPAKEGFSSRCQLKLKSSFDMQTLTSMPHAPTTMSGKTEISAEFHAAQFHQQHHRVPMGAASHLSAAGLWCACWQALRNT